MDYVCVKMTDPVTQSIPLESYLQRLVVTSGSPVACRRVATFPLSNEGLVKSSSLVGRSHSDPKDIHSYGVSLLATTDTDYRLKAEAKEKHAVCKLSTVRPKKSVTFADDQGCQLVQVIVMTEPSDVPPKINPAVLRALGISDDWTLDSANAASTWKVEFAQPASDYSKFRAKVQSQNVAVENVLIDNEHHRVSGIVKVKNVCFEKAVVVRYTTDSWQTFYDKPARYLRSAGCEFDNFQFDFELAKDDGKCSKVEFCVCFKDSRNKEYWDNNEGKNFEISSESLRNSRAHKHDTSSSDGSGGGSQPIRRNSSCTDAFLLDHPNWTEFASWSDLSSSAPYW